MGVEDVTSHFRKCVAGEWRLFFGDKHKAYFKRYFNWVLVFTGYVHGATWQAQLRLPIEGTYHTVDVSVGTDDA